MNSLTIKEIASAIDARVIGDESHVLSGLASVQQASDTDLTFLSSASYEKYLQNTQAGAVILSEKSADLYQGNKLVADNPYVAYAKASALFDPRPKRHSGIHPSAVVAESAQIASGVSIGAHCTVGDNVEIGKDCEIYPGVVISENCVVGDACLIHANVSLYSNTRIGSHVIIHSGTVIGSDGFGFAPTKEGWVKIHQLGGVVIGDRVEIGSNTSIDRGAIGDTVIKAGVIIDNLVHIAHNVEVGENTAIAGCVGIAGSAVIGKNCTVAGAVAINGHITIADDSHFHGGTIVTKGIKEAGVYASAPPMQDVKKWRRTAVRYSQLDDIANRIKNLEKTK